MKVDLYERMWMWAAGAIIVVFVATIFLMAAVGSPRKPHRDRRSNYAR
jgi:hypothetical protein